MSNGSKPFVLNNPHLNGEDFLYHLNLSSSDNLQQRFQDVKFVVMGGKAARMKSFSDFVYKQLNQPQNCEFVSGSTELFDISAGGGRYSMFKVGNVLAVNHGIGMASLSVVLNEVFKLLYYAKCSDVMVFRIGTSGGIGVTPGTAILTYKAYTPMFDNFITHVSCGKEFKYEATTDDSLREEILNTSKSLNLPLMVGNTIATNDFFEEQGRCDGAFCDYTDEDKMNFLRRAHDQFGVRNIEMESTLFSAMCKRASVRCAVLCTTLLNRLNGDQVIESKETMHRWEHNLFEILANFIKNCK